MLKKLSIGIVMIGLLCIGITGTASALPLAPGAFADINISTALPTGSSGNTLLASIIDAPFAAVGGQYSGLFTEYVYSNSDGLLFVYQFTNNESSVDPIARMTVTDYQGFDILDVGALNLGGNDQPHYADRTSSGGTVGFQHGQMFTTDHGVSPDGTSSLEWVQTNARYFGPGTASFIDGSTVTIPALGPAVPEPASMVLLGLGLAGLARLRRKA